MEEYRYLAWLSLSWVPTIILWIKFSKLLRPYFRVGIYLNLLTFIPGLIWDRFAVAYGVWYFVPPFSTSLIWQFFPLEEFILMASFPWFILTATVLFSNFLDKNNL